MNRSDRFILSSAVAVMTLLTSVYFKKSAPFCTILTALSLVLSFILFGALQKASSRARYSEFKLYHSVVDPEKLKNLIKIYLNSLYTDFDDYSEKKRIMLIISAKDGGITRSELLSGIRQALTEGYETVFCICERLPSESLRISGAFSVSLKFISLRRAYVFLRRRNYLPAIDGKRRFTEFLHSDKYSNDALSNAAKLKRTFSQVTKASFSDAARSVADTLFSKRNAFRFLLSAAFMGVIFFLTPFRIYYLTFTAVLLTLSMICVLKNAVF